MAPARKTGGSRPRGRRPGPSRTREEILTSARAVFGERGFAGATVKEIAVRANVDPALIIQFFGSKQRLFAAALELPFDPAAAVAAVLTGPRNRIGARMVETFLRLWDDPEVGPRMLVLVRSAATHEAAAARLRDLVETSILGAVAKELGLPDAALRVQLVGSQLVGLGFARHVLGLQPLASTDPAELRELIGPVIQRYLTGRIESRRALVS
jgi:AcrR family transcriptional regulator